MAGVEPGAELYADNAAAMWASLAPLARVVPGAAAGLSAVEIAPQSAIRVILRRPLAADPGQIAALVAGAGPGWRVVVEDSFGALVLPSGDGIAVDRMPLMIRPAGDAVPGRPAGGGIRVVQAIEPEALAIAEQVIVDGFPRRPLQPFQPGRMLPPEVLSAPGWRIWLAYRDDRPAAAGCSYDDGVSVGVYWLATLPQHRGAGLGRAVMSAVIGACPHLPTTLVATVAGEPLYASLGFRPVTRAAWFRIPGSGR